MFVRWVLTFSACRTFYRHVASNRGSGKKPLLFFVLKNTEIRIAP